MLPKGLLKEYSRTLSLLIRFMDMLTIFIAGWLAYFIKFDTFTLSFPYFIAILVGISVALPTFTFFNIYSSVRSKGFLNYFFTLLQGIILTAILLAGVAFITKVGESYSRLWFIEWMILVSVLLILFRCGLLLLLRFMRSKGLNERRVVILGAGVLGMKLAETVQQALWTGYRIIALMDDFPKNQTSSLTSLFMKTPDNLSEYLTKHTVDEIWLALPLRAEARVKEVLHELRHHTITTRFVLDIFGMDLLNHSIDDVAGFPVLNIRSTPMVGMNRLIKAIEDRILSAIILILISPLFLMIATLVKLTSEGPVFFKQNRLGWDGRIIKVYKFRTMYQHEEKDNQVTQATSSDKRVTPLGRFLRRSSLDELPQFINVLQGRMSIVGPRPHALAHNELYKDSVHIYMQRHRVKPGITGWAQVNGWRGETDTLNKMQKRVEYDLYYINNWSLKFDLKIIFLTFLRGFINRNAY